MDWSNYECEGQLSIFDLEKEDTMKEVTRIVTVKYTHVFKERDDVAEKMTAAEEKQKYAERIKKQLEFFLNADDVNIADVQCFVRDEEE